MWRFWVFPLPPDGEIYPSDGIQLFLDPIGGDFSEAWKQASEVLCMLSGEYSGVLFEPKTDRPMWTGSGGDGVVAGMFCQGVALDRIVAMHAAGCPGSL